MAIKLIIHKIDQEQKTAIASLTDGERFWFDNKNITLILNPDGTVDKTWLKQVIKITICSRRLEYMEKNEKDLV